MISHHCHFKNHQSTVSPTFPKSLPLLEHQTARRLEVSSRSTAGPRMLLSLQGTAELTRKDRMAFFSPQLLLLVTSSVCSLGQNEINRDLLWRSKKGITAQRLHRKREILFLEIPRQRDRSRMAEEEVQAPGLVAPGGPTRLLEHVPPEAAL